MRVNHEPRTGVRDPMRVIRSAFLFDEGSFPLTRRSFTLG
jgi:hypothetical protein